MSVLRCARCSAGFDAEQMPGCPRCQAETWLAAEMLVTQKHDPSAVDQPWDTYRSILTPAFVEHRAEFLAYAAHHGRWLFDDHYECWVHYTKRPLAGRVPGVGVPAGRTSADHALDSLMIADANEPEAHAFAVDESRTESQIRVGVFTPLAHCESPSCGNLCVPGTARCIAHTAL